MNKHRGFTLIEVMLLIIVTGLLASTVLLAMVTAAQKTPAIQSNIIAAQTAKKCMEWFIGQRSLNGYGSFSCPSTTVPAFCTVPTGYTLSVTVSCTTINSDTNYQTVAVSVTGAGNATLTTLFALY